MRHKFLKTAILLSLMIIYLIFYKFYVFENYLEFSEYITAAITIVITSLAILFFGFQKDKLTELKKGVLISGGILLLGFFSLYYGSGLFLGYLKSAYALNASSILHNILAIGVILISIETLRYVMINANKDSKLYRIIITSVICIFEIVFVVVGQNLANVEDLFKVFAQIVLPLIMKNYAMTYIVRYAGLRPTLLFRLVIDLYPYIVPIVPDVGDYVNAIVKTGLPLLFFIQSYRIVEDTIKGVEYDFKKPLLKKTDIPVVIFILVVSLLISGKFQYHLLSIGSQSMSPTIMKGDAVLLDKGKTAIKNIKKNDIVAYNKNGIVIIHRVVEITNKKGKMLYKTKGDANNSIDRIDLTQKDIIGVVKIKFKYIGYPSVFITENFSK